jgi:hypothetical protein
LLAVLAFLGPVLLEDTTLFKKGTLFTTLFATLPAAFTTFVAAFVTVLNILVAAFAVSVATFDTTFAVSVATFDTAFIAVSAAPEDISSLPRYINYSPK